MSIPGPNADLFTTHQCLELWNQGFSASGVAEKLGITRNAVLGRLHRYKIKNPNVQIERRQLLPESGYRTEKRERKPRVYKRAHKPIVIMPKPALPKVLRSPEPPLPFVELLGGVQWHADNGCCWINSETGHLPVLWCNAPVPAGAKSWCAYHARLMISRAVSV